MRNRLEILMALNTAMILLLSVAIFVGRMRLENEMRQPVKHRCDVWRCEVYSI